MPQFSTRFRCAPLLLGTWLCCLLLASCQKEDPVCTYPEYILAGEGGPCIKVKEVNQKVQMELLAGLKLEGSLDLDLDDNGTTDFVLRLNSSENPPTPDGQHWLILLPYSQNERVMVQPWGSRYAYAFEQDDTIGIHHSWDETDGNWTRHGGDLSRKGIGADSTIVQGLWSQPGRKYLGVRFPDEDCNQLYGWIEVDFTGLEATVVRYGSTQPVCMDP